jgi:hypothetical protein
LDGLARSEEVGVDHFNVSAVWRGHWSALGRNSLFHGVPIRALFVVAPLGLGGVALWQCWTLSAPAGLLTGVSILIGGALTVFAQLVGLRTRLRTDLDEEWMAAQRDALDETVAHLLTAVLFAIVDATILVLGMNLAAPDGHVPTPITAATLALSSYLVLLLVLCVPRLYSAYTTGFVVAKHLDGHHRGLRPWQ